MAFEVIRLVVWIVVAFVVLRLANLIGVETYAAILLASICGYSAGYLTACRRLTPTPPEPHP